MSLSHKHPDCTGRWVQQIDGGAVSWRCEHCRAIAFNSDANALAAVQENRFGTMLRVLADAGDRLLLNDEEELGE